MRSTMTGARDERAVIAAASAVRSQQRWHAARYEPGCENASVTGRKVGAPTRAVRRATRVAFTASCVSCQHSLKAVGSMASASAWPCCAPDVRVSMRSKGRRTRSPNRWTCVSATDRLPAQSIERLDARAQARAPLRALNADLSRPASSAATARTRNSPPAPANAPRARSPDAGSHAAPAARSTTCRYAGACGPPRPT